VLLSALKRAWSAYKEKTTRLDRIALGIFLGIAAAVALSIIAAVVPSVYTEYHSEHAPSSEQLEMARTICPAAANDALACDDSGMNKALHHLDLIPSRAPEYNEASKLRSLIYAFQVKLAADRQKAYEEHGAMLIKQKAEHDRLINQSFDESIKQWQRNLSGQAHDQYLCGTSENNSPIISFDFGHYWWTDDGRCAAVQQAQREIQEAREAADQRRRAEEQKQKDADAESSSYWPTTLRVDTDMDSFWLPNEERTCQTSPDDKGRVAVVACNTSGSHRDHNIPVKFWGGVDRNTISSWKCRRESDQFVCRAIN
jgi:hypothetical protein